MALKRIADAEAFTVAEFCQAHRISVPMFYKLRRQGEGPAVMKIGAHIRISKEAAARWRQQLEQKEAAAS